MQKKNQIEAIILNDNVVEDKHIAQLASLSKSNQQFYCTSLSWAKKEMRQVCALIKEWRVFKIQAYGNGDSLILKDIEDIRFSRLISLNAWGNKIVSIEGLCRSNMPCLKKLWLWENNITSFNSLRKCSIFELNHLNIKQNPINDQQCLTELSTEKKLTRFHINNYRFCSWIVKIQAEKIQDLNFQHLFKNQQYERIDQPALQNQFKLKFIQIQLKW